ncbi:hypothetical protein OV208_20865 [Corallococcus sp. bb12-1]|uniref:hypothetical protein n=1 Tax=Corallococcus sp. bb12-1 TaxID=2996784 RepID=UPI00226E16B4|nr:hypothetical protein [Corallococcus sp. bb12-1]MCY1043784.1 hypothetical protein [Corallococcus sp. bb12-1]
MRLDILGCVLMLGLSVGCATRREGPTAQQRREALRDWERQGSRYRSPEGFQEARWGMTLEEVQALFPEAGLLNGNALRWKTLLAKMPAIVTLGFVENRFAAVDVFSPEVRNSREAHLLLRRLLSRKYGTPGRDRDTVHEAQRRVGSYRSAADAVYFLGKVTSSLPGGVPPDLYGQQRMDLRAENDEMEARREARAAQKRFLLMSHWETVESQVLLTSVTAPGVVAVVVEYESSRYAPEIAKARRQAMELEQKRMAKDF